MTVRRLRPSQGGKMRSVGPDQETIDKIRATSPEQELELRRDVGTQPPVLVDGAMPWVRSQVL